MAKNEEKPYVEMYEARGTRVKKLFIGIFTSRVLYRWEDLLSTIPKFHDDFYFHKAAGTCPWFRPCMKTLVHNLVEARIDAHFGQESAWSRWRDEELGALHLGPKDPLEKKKVSGTQNEILKSRSRLKSELDETSPTNQRTRKA